MRNINCKIQTLPMDEKSVDCSLTLFNDTEHTEILLLLKGQDLYLEKTESSVCLNESMIRKLIHALESVLE